MKKACVLAALILLAALAALPGVRGREVKVGADTRAVVKGNTEFALRLYGQLRTEKGNLFCSPYSVSTALAMTYAGARGETAEEMAQALDFPFGQERLHPAFAALLAEVKGGDRKRAYELRVANALWGQKDYGFLPDFLNLTRRDYGAGLREVDFIAHTEQARRAINGWVEKQTNDKIKNLLRRGILTADTRLVLTNAIYFKGLWAAQFPKQDTREGPFRTAAGPVPVPMMHRTGHYKYLDGDDFQALELPYKGDELSMVVLLPKKTHGLAELEAKLTAPNLTAWLGRLQKQEVVVALPRFKLTREFRLNDALKALGMRRAFLPGGADFRGMAGSEGRNLFISAVIHKALVDVNEEGTEAAAATAVVLEKKDLAGPPPRFRADHPFVFLVHDHRSGSLLFLGRLTNPA